MQPIVNPTYQVSDLHKRRLMEATQVSCYGRNFFRGLHAYSGDHGVWHRIKTYAAAVFGSLFFGATTYFSVDGAVRMVDVSLQDDPIPSDVGHGGEWLQQPFQYGLALHMYLISAFSNRGCLEEVKGIYSDIIADIANQEDVDIEELYHKLEADILFLAKRAVSGANLFEVRTFLIDLFRTIDLDLVDCETLRVDRELRDHYRALMGSLKESQAWTCSNIVKDTRDGLRLLGRRGVGQAIEKGAGVVVFDLAMLVSVGFMLWGLTIVFDEVFLSRSAPESSGHLSEWSINILTNLTLIYLVHSWTIKREVTLYKTRRVMIEHLRPEDEEAGGHGLNGQSLDRLLGACNELLDRLAEKCQFNTLPSQYRLEPPAFELHEESE